jgi:hypothetical protein
MKEKVKCKIDIGNGPNKGIIKGFIKQEDKIESEFHDNKYELKDIITGYFNHILNLQ